MNNIKINPTKINLCKIAERKLELYEAIAKQKDITIHNEISKDSFAFADENHILLVLRNLIGNSLKFTQSGGNITISAENKDENVIISVADTGIGMSETVRAKIFASDSIFTTQGTAGEKGTGLGLMLCKEFVEKNNGKIWVESEEGRGTIFKFSLPLK
jgi:signal transduction histidine kinase